MGWKAAQKLIQNWKILRGDNVMIIRGKDQGETGFIKRVVRSQNRVIVEGKNLLFWDLIPPGIVSGSQNGALYLFDFVPAHGRSD